eukprot:333953-Pyramimonas_sp.AAC.1
MCIRDSLLNRNGRVWLSLASNLPARVPAEQPRHRPWNLVVGCDADGKVCAVHNIDIGQATWLTKKNKYINGG